MNKAKRQKLADAAVYVSHAIGIVRMVQDSEQDSFDNMPENLQDSYQCEKMENAIDNMEDASDHLEEALHHINKAWELINRARE